LGARGPRPIAAIELLDALSSVQGIFTDYHHETALLRFAQEFNSIKLAISPLLAGTALFFAARGNIRYAVFALAALTLAGWLLDSLPTIVIHGFKPSLDFDGIIRFLPGFAGHSGHRDSTGVERATPRLGGTACLPAGAL
jgi:hypothetical protein